MKSCLLLMRENEYLWREELTLPATIFKTGPNKLFTAQSDLTTFKKKPYKSTVGKGENTGNQHFLLLPQCFLAFLTRGPVVTHLSLLDF